MDCFRYYDQVKVKVQNSCEEYTYNENNKITYIQKDEYEKNEHTKVELEQRDICCPQNICYNNTYMIYVYHVFTIRHTK
jgi:uncharacterized protein with ParB-like and HNH nuclease domain